MVNGASAGGITDSRPETHCTSTRSPDSMVITGGNKALNTPIRTVSGLARKVCVVMVQGPPYATIAGRRERD